MGHRRVYSSHVADSRRWDGFAFRDDDIVIATPSKCGTTWMQLLVALVVFDGRPFPHPVTDMSPWVDMHIRTRAETTALLDAQDHRRFLKTHVPLDGLPIDDRVTYVVVGRDPRDAWLSMVEHVDNIDRDTFMSTLATVIGEDELKARLAARTPVEDFADAVDRPVGHCHTMATPPLVVHHLHDAWARRARPNVALFHYRDLTVDLPGELARLAHVLDVDLPPTRLAELAEEAGFDAMRADASNVAPDVSARYWHDTEGFFRKGRIDEWRTALPADALRRYQQRVTAQVDGDEQFLRWVHGGQHGTADWRL